MSTLREVPGPRITPFLQILYGLFNLLLIGGLVYSFKNTGGFHHKLSSSPKNLSSGLMHQHDACPPVPAAKRVEKVVEGAVLDSWHASYKPLHSPNRFPRCSMDVCFNFSRCDNMDELLVYHYDDFNPPKWFFEALKATPYSTSDPEKACIFLVTVDRRMEEPRIPDLKTLPHWNHGLNHVLISFVDNWSKWRNPMPATLEKAAIMTSITHQTTYRPAFDISVPLPALKYYEDLQELKAFQRKYFLTFKGTRYLSEFGGGGFRSHPSMRGMHNGKDVIVVTTCRQVPYSSFRPFSLNLYIPVFATLAICASTIAIRTIFFTGPWSQQQPKTFFIPVGSSIRIGGSHCEMRLEFLDWEAYPRSSSLPLSFL